jgi:hypothetical protein
MCRGHEIKITLWGERAVEFDAGVVRAMGEREPVIAIFVGTLLKTIHGDCFSPGVSVLCLF